MILRSEFIGDARESRRVEDRVGRDENELEATIARKHVTQLEELALHCQIDVGLVQLHRLVDYIRIEQVDSGR